MRSDRETGAAMRRRLLPLREFHTPGEPFMKLTDTQKKLVRDFNRTVSEGVLEMETAACLCGSRSFGLIASIDRYAMLQDTVICTGCGLIQSNPRMTDGGYRDFYASDTYRLCYEGENYLSIYEKRYEPKSTRHIFDEVSNAMPIKEGVSVLEVGAGGGWNLVPFLEAGARVRGVDYSKSLVGLGTKHGLEMVQGGIDAVSGIFDVIILNHVIEHFTDPVKALKKLKGHLKNRGIFYISAPNILNFGMGQLQNAHVYYFTPSTFAFYCSRAGLKAIKAGPSEKIHMFGIFTPSDDPPLQEPKGQYAEMVWFFRKARCKYMVKRLLAGLKLLKR